MRAVVPGAGGAISTFYAQLNRTPIAVAESFDASGGTYWSPRCWRTCAPLGGGCRKKTVEVSTARKGLQGRRPKRRRGLTHTDGAARHAPDPLRRDFSTEQADRKWVGDFKQIHTAQEPVFLATIEDLFSRRLLGFALSGRHQPRP